MFAWSWPETELEGGSDIGLSICRQKWDQPSFVLHTACKTEARSGEDICIHCYVILVSSLGNITGVESAVPEFESELLARAEPIASLNLFALRGSSDPCSDQTATVGVSANVLRVGINAITTKGGRIGVSAFKSQVQLRNSREFCEVESSLGGVPPHIREG